MAVHTNFLSNKSSLQSDAILFQLNAQAIYFNCGLDQPLASVDTAADRDKLSRNPAALLAGQQQHRIGDVLHRSDPVLVSSKRKEIVREGLDLGGVRQVVGCHRARCEGVDGNPLAVSSNLRRKTLIACLKYLKKRQRQSYFSGQRKGQLVHGGLGSSVDGERVESHFGGYASNVDDTRELGHKRVGLLKQNNRADNCHIKGLANLLCLGLKNGALGDIGCIIDYRINALEAYFLRHVGKFPY